MSGNFVVVWEGTGSASGVFGQRFASSGSVEGTEFRVNASGGGLAPAVASDVNGNFLVVWENADGDFSGVAGRHFSSNGSALGTEFRVNQSTIWDQRSPSVAADSRGDFVVVWRTSDPSGYETFIEGRSFSSNGVALGGDFGVNSYTTGWKGAPSVASDQNGNFTVVWANDDLDGSAIGIFGQRFLSDIIFADGFESGALSA